MNTRRSALRTSRPPPPVSLYWHLRASSIAYAIASAIASAISAPPPMHSFLPRQLSTLPRQLSTRLVSLSLSHLSGSPPPLLRARPHRHRTSRLLPPLGILSTPLTLIQINSSVLLYYLSLLRARPSLSFRCRHHRHRTFSSLSSAALSLGTPLSHSNPIKS